jgi:kinetochore protein Nuf2
MKEGKKDKEEKMTFPPLTSAAILQSMNDLEVPFTSDDLAKPTTAKILQVFEIFTDQLMGVNQDIQSFSVDMLDYPEICRDSIALLGFYRQLHKLFSLIGVEQFSIRDLLKPEPARLKHILSAIINFCKFREDQLSIFEICTQKSVLKFNGRNYLTMRSGFWMARLRTSLRK